MSLVCLSFHDRCVQISSPRLLSIYSTSRSQSRKIRHERIILPQKDELLLYRSPFSSILPFEFPLIFLSPPFLSLSLSRDRVYRRDCATSTHDRRADADLKRNFENGTLSAAPARQVLQRPSQHRSGIRRESIDFSNLTLTIITTNLFFSFSKLFLVTWIRLFRVAELAILAEAAPELGVTLHREHAEYRHILVLLFRPPYPLLAHRLGLQVKLARQSFAQRVRGHFSLTTTLFNHLQIKLRCQISKRSTFRFLTPRDAPREIVK